jgi:hypothetical protein
VNRARRDGVHRVMDYLVKAYRKPLRDFLEATR